MKEEEELEDIARMYMLLKLLDWLRKEEKWGSRAYKEYYTREILTLRRYVNSWLAERGF